MKKEKKYQIIVLIIFFLVLIIFFNINKSEKVVFMAVGQGDASLIYTKDRTILIDGGPDWTVLLELAKVLKYKMKINDIVITHPHSDHYFGLAEILDRYEVDNIYYYGDNIGSDSYNIFINSIKESNIRLINVERGDKISLRDNCYLYFLWPIKGKDKDFDANELSIVNYFTCGKQRILFTGDISGAVEKRLISMDKNLEFEVLKSAHHGSNKSNSWDFLSFFSPKEIVISAGKDNKHGLPSPEAINRAKALRIEVQSLVEGKSYEVLIN